MLKPVVLTSETKQTNTLPKSSGVASQNGRTYRNITNAYHTTLRVSLIVFVALLVISSSPMDPDIDLRI